MQQRLKWFSTISSIFYFLSFFISWKIQIQLWKKIYKRKQKIEEIKKNFEQKLTCVDNLFGIQPSSINASTKCSIKKDRCKFAPIHLNIHHFLVHHNDTKRYLTSILRSEKNYRKIIQSESLEDRLFSKFKNMPEKTKDWHNR